MNFQQKYFFDYASGTPINSKIANAMLELGDAGWVNPSAEYAAARVARDVHRQSIDRIAQAIQARPAEIVITSGATESNNMVIKSALNVGHVIVSEIEHPSIIAICKGSNSVSFAPVNKNGLVEVSELKKLIRDNTVLISVMLVNNEIGTVQPLKEIANIVEEIKQDRLKQGNRFPIYIHTDAAQAPYLLSVIPQKLGVDLMTLSSGKIYGPKATGLLYISSKAAKFIKPLMLGGGQQRGMRSGTEDTLSVYGFSLALQKAVLKSKTENRRLESLQKMLLNDLDKLGVDIQINGTTKKRIANNVSVVFRGYDAERLAMELDDLGVSVAIGSACSAANDEPSHVLHAIGLSDQDARSTLRFSFGVDTDKDSIEYAVKSLKAIFARA